MANGKTVPALVDFALGNSFVEHYDFGPSLTRQEFAEEADINVIMRRFEKTGMLPQVQGQPVFMDFTVLPPDLLSTLTFMDNAHEEFMRLPAGVRKEFDNDAVAFVEFAANPDNIGKMREWGLAPPAAVEPSSAAAEPPAVPAAPPAAAPPAASPRA